MPITSVPGWSPLLPPLFSQTLYYNDTYAGNQLVKTEYTGSGLALSQLMDFKNNVNLTAEYFYDKNANQIKDCNKIVTEISYNVLNLPQTLKEYHWNKKTGEYEQNTKWYQTKTRMEGIEKGILSDGINFKGNDNVISVGGEEAPTVTWVENFVIELSEMVGLEIGGFEYSKKGLTEVSNVYSGRYQSSKDKPSRWNTDQKTYSVFDPKVAGQCQMKWLPTLIFAHLSHFFLIVINYNVLVELTAEAI